MRIAAGSRLRSVVAGQELTHPGLHLEMKACFLAVYRDQESPLQQECVRLLAYTMESRPVFQAMLASIRPLQLVEVGEHVNTVGLG